MKYKIWDKQENLVTPITEASTPSEVFAKYPASRVDGLKFIIADQPINMAVFMELETTKRQYASLGVTFTNDMTDQQVLDAITAFEETPQPQQIPSPEERIAAALEYQA